MLHWKSVASVTNATVVPYKTCLDSSVLLGDGEKVHTGKEEKRPDGINRYTST